MAKLNQDSRIRRWRRQPPTQDGWWWYRESCRDRKERVLIQGGCVADDYEVSQAVGREIKPEENYWEGTDTDQDSMPGLWMFDEEFTATVPG